LEVEQARYPAAAPAKHNIVAQPATESAPAQDETPEPVANSGIPEIKVRPPMDPALVAALRCYLNKRPAEALGWLEHYDQQSQDFLLALLPLAAQLTEGKLSGTDPREAAALLAQMERVAGILRPLAPLRIDNLCFCPRDHVPKFGVYRRLSEDVPFRPGQTAKVYFELQNFSCERHGQIYGIRLATRLEIREFNGTSKWHHDFPDEYQSELLQSPCHDFFNTYTFPIPKQLGPGMYTFALRVTDRPTGRTAEQTLDFRVVPNRD
jgi:hypothetical protein